METTKKELEAYRKASEIQINSLSTESIEQVIESAMSYMTHPATYGRPSITDEEDYRKRLIGLYKAVHRHLPEAGVNGIFHLICVLKRHENRA